MGIRSKKLSRATIYTSNIYQLNPIYDFAVEHMGRAEDTYKLKYNNNVNIYVSTSKKEFDRWVPPWINTGVGGVSLYIGNTIYINPEAINNNHYNEEEFLKHELVHNLIAQNSALLSGFVFEQQEWFSEGTATYFGGPTYMNENEFRSMMKNNTLIYDDKSSKLFINLDQKEYKFKMMVYSYFIKYLIDQYGNNLFTSFLKQYIDSPGNYKLIFFEVYNKPFKLVVEDFKKVYGAK